MKKILIILICLPMIGFGQTLIPDANFEQALINLGYDTGTPNGSVPTANIDTVTNLQIGNQSISDLTGIEDFTALITLYCSWNQLTSLDVSNNTALIYLWCYNNQLTSLDVSANTALTDLNCGYNLLTSLDVSNNTALITLYCSWNQLTSLDVSANTALTNLSCGDNQLTSLDVSNNTALTDLSCGYNLLASLDVSNNTALTNLYCRDNQLTSLDVRNGNNTNLSSFWTTDNLDLYCIDVDNAAWSTANWTVANGSIDVQQYFSTNCNPIFGCTDTLACNYYYLANVDDGSCEGLLGCIDSLACNYVSGPNCDDGSCDLPNGCGDPIYVEYDPLVTCSDPNACITLIISGIEIYNLSDKKLLKVTDLLGRETKQTNQPLIYIYDDGTVEKRIVI
jgi:hypothetical protein